uniref:Uncharacterized protein n=1 Tax=Daucus carota subsp. sativus TaxID=79200 RepID=A0A165A2P5_DAUCS
MLGTTTRGGLVEYAVAKQEVMVLRPLELSAGECAALGTRGLTAYQCLITAGVAKLGNIHVTITCGSCTIDFVKKT